MSSETTTASARTVDLSCSFSGVTTAFCTTDQEKATIKSALISAVTVNNTIMCLKNGKCNMTDFTCNHNSANSELMITFRLKQVFDLDYPNVLTDDVTSFEKSSIYIMYNDGTKKRATVTTSTISDAVATTTTTCPSGYLDDDSGNCVQCNLGYGNNGGKCEKCGLGTYSSTKDISVCTACSGNGVTTMNTGSNSSSDCIQTSMVCVVPSNPDNGLLVPATTARVITNANISTYCNSGYAVAFGVSEVFACQSDATVPACDGMYFPKII